MGGAEFGGIISIWALKHYNLPILYSFYVFLSRTEGLQSEKVSITKNAVSGSPQNDVLS